MKSAHKLTLFCLILTSFFMLTSCGSSPEKSEAPAGDTAALSLPDTAAMAENEPADNAATTGDASVKKEEKPVVLVYNFHVTNRCASCIAIEDGTTKTLNTYFAAEMKSGRVKRFIVNVDDEANEKIAEKYQVFGSGIYITRVFKGNETTTDLTGDGFKFALNKEDRFIEILKTKIADYLK